MNPRLATSHLCNYHPMKQQQSSSLSSSSPPQQQQQRQRSNSMMTTTTIEQQKQQQPLSPQYIRQRPLSMSQMMRTSYFSCTTYSEFTGHRGQQHSAPVHPPHPSRSSLAVARSLSERSKEDKCFESSFSDVPTGGQAKSMADQIDEVMEQLNANCDFSMDDLFGATNSASTSTLNAPQIGPDGKPIKSKKQPQSGLTKKSQSASQLSVTGK